MLDGYTYSKTTEKIVTDMMQACIITAIETGKNLILDETNLNKKFLDEKIDMFIRNGYEIEIKDFPITIGEALTRDAARQFPIGASVIKRTWRNYEIELKEMIEIAKPKYEWNGNLPYCLICDIDGTLSNSSQRKIFDFKECVNDKIIFPVWSILEKYKGKVDVILMSGREEICRAETEEWLKKENVNYQALHMRKEKDYRDDTIIKKELFEEYIKNKYQPMLVIDDRPSVVQMWVDLGLFVFNVNQDPWAKNPF